MSLNARSIALRGFGYGALAIATAGFIAASPVDKRNYGGGGGRSEHEQYLAQQEQHAFELHKQILEEDEILILAVAQLVVNGAFT